MTFLDLTRPESQGSFGHDRIDELTEPGFYKLPFKAAKPNGEIYQRDIAVHVVSVFPSHGQSIVVEDTFHDFEYIFYYNGNEKLFKPNFEGGPSLDEVYDMIDFEAEDRKLEEESNAINVDVDGVPRLSTEAEDLTEMDATEIQKKIDGFPGFYKIRLHENISGPDKTLDILALIVASYTVNGTLMIVLSDNHQDYFEVMYWNGGWKFNRDMNDSLEDWLSWYDFNRVSSDS